MDELRLLNINIDRDLSCYVKSYYVFNNCIDSQRDSWKTNTLFVTIDNIVFGFGENENGVCGHGHNYKINRPLIINGLSDKGVEEFINGIDFVLALTSENQLYSWGRNDHGQLGIGCVKDNRFYEPQLIEFFNNIKIVQVCCGERHSLVLTEEGVVYGWGDNRYGQTGGGEEGEENVVSPTQWFIKGKVSKIHCSRYKSFAITKEGNVYCCGRKNHSEFALKYGEI